MLNLKYQTYAIEIKPKSSFITPLQADTIFGSLMWAWRYLKGEERLVEVLEAFSEAPLFLLSNGFPKGYLPRPLIPLFEPTESLEEARIQKKVKKITLIPEEDYKELVNNLSSFSLADLLRKLSNRSEIFFKKEPHYKNVINRLSFTTLEGGLFVQEETYYAKDLNWVIYLSFGQDQSLISLEEIKQMFNFLSLSGYGKRKSTGKGSFEIIDIKQHKLPEANNPNAFISLSNYVPAPSDPADGFYELVLKYGKLGGDYAVNKPGPWKKPLRMIKAGSVFRINGELKDYYGVLVSGIYPYDDKVKHYAYAYPLGVRLV